jgi:hypothetical protein
MSAAAVKAARVAYCAKLDADILAAQVGSDEAQGMYEAIAQHAASMRKLCVRLPPIGSVGAIIKAFDDEMQR